MSVENIDMWIDFEINFDVKLIAINYEQRIKHILKFHVINGCIYCYDNSSI